MRLFFALAILALLCACTQGGKPEAVVVDTRIALVSAPHFVRTPAAPKVDIPKVDLGPGSYATPHPKEWGGAAFDPVAFDKWLQTHNPQPKEIESRRPP